MTQDSSDGGQSGGGSVSIGQEDQLRERRMERRQRREDDGIDVPPGSNPHAQSPGAGPHGSTAPARTAMPAAGGEDDEIWEGRADEPEHPGQTEHGGLGGSGPVQP